MNKKIISPVKKVVISILSIITISILFGAFKCFNYIDKINKVNIDKEQVVSKDHYFQKENPSSDVTENTVKQKYIKNIALLGIDSGEDNVGRSDCILIATIDTEHDKIKLSSIIRDSYVNIPGRDEKDKINHAYAFGGPQLSLETINNNFNLNITQFISVNLSSFPKIIDSIGGITLNITDEELKYINSYINSLNTINNTSSPNITYSGTQTVDGTQALAYARIRYTAGGDFERSHRQRMVLENVFHKLKSLPLLKYPETLDLLLPIVDTNLTSSEILSLSFDLASIDNSKITEERFPKDEDGEGKMINGVYYYVFDEDATVEKIHEFIYE